MLLVMIVSRGLTNGWHCSDFRSSGHWYRYFRYRQIPTFGGDTIRRFSKNASAMKKLAARDFEDLLQVRGFHLIGSCYLILCIVRNPHFRRSSSIPTQWDCPWSTLHPCHLACLCQAPTAYRNYSWIFWSDYHRSWTNFATIREGNMYSIPLTSLRWC
jgi:hypothetical protein